MLVLKRSPFQGIGVFTTVAIRKGTKVPLFAPEDWRIVRAVRGLERRYCHRASDGGWFAPLDFNRMSIGWYLNHSRAPNVSEDAERESERGIALRHIRAGEELTIDYELIGAKI